MNRFTKTISSMLLCSQLVFVLPALASQTPETTLLTNMIALRGTTMSPDDHAKAVESIYKSYDQAAPEEDRSDRLEQSLVDMKILTAAQSAQFTAEAKQSSKKLETGQLADDAAIQNELQQLASSFSKGAQFSDCSQSAVATGYSLLIGGFIATVVGAYERRSVENSINSSHALSDGLLYGGASVFAAGAIVLVVGGNDCDSN